MRAAVRAGRFAAAAFQAESDRWFLWSPVLLAFGIAIYFGLSFEPPLWAALTPAAVLAMGLAGLSKRGPEHGPLTFAGIGCLCVALGFGAASFRSASVAAPVLEKPWAGTLEGRVIEVERTARGEFSALIAPSMMERLDAARMPVRLRLRISIAKGPAEAELIPGETVRLRARLLPPPEPVEPGGFDYARQVWFERLGAVGYAFSAPERLAAAPEDMATRLQRLRASITARIQTQIGGAAGAVAAALVTGEGRAIPEWAETDLRNAGLAHVLSISGLHMVLFGGSLFWIVRAALALWPAAALNFPIKKWGAVAALMGTTFYLLISGAAIATQRAYIMIALMFVAVLLDRPALSMRNVALAALVILLWRPESLLGAGFQMSFAAVVALIAFYESPWVQRLSAFARQGTGGPVSGMLRFAASHALGIALTTFVAGFATGAYAAFHFDRIAVYGLAGNMGAMPIASAVIMPAALAALLLMPSGLDGPALWLMGQGIEGMLWVAHQVSNWPGADRLVASAPMASLALVTLGGLWMALWRGSWRFWGAAPLLLGLALWGSGTRPDVLIDRDGALAAVRTQGGVLALTAARPAYAAGQWLRRDGDARSAKEAAATPGMRCDSLGCAYREAGRPVIAFPATLDAVAADCEVAEVVVARVSIPRRMREECAARVIIDRLALWRDGATALHFRPDGSIGIETSRQARGARPWVQRKSRVRQAEAEAEKPSPALQ